MKIYLVVRTDEYGYDEYDSVVVCEKTPQKAMKFCEQYFHKGQMACELIGVANTKQKAGEILTSFYAG